MPGSMRTTLACTMAALAAAALPSAAETFADLTKASEAAARASATRNGVRVRMVGEGVETSDGSKYPPENVFDDDPLSFTCAHVAPTPASPLEVVYDFGEATPVNCYRLHAFSTAGGAGFPKTWAFEGSDDGETWTTLDARKDKVLESHSWSTFFYDGGGRAFSRYRLKVTETASTRRFDLAEMELGNVTRTAAADSEEPARTLRIAHYNIHHGEGKDGKYDLRRVLGSVECGRQDLVALNEVDWGSKRVGGAITAAEIEQLTGMHVEYARAKPYMGGYYGNAVASREEPRAVERIDLPRGDGKNGLKCVLLLCEFEDCWFGTAHLDLRANLENQFRSVEIIRAAVAEKSNAKPVFLTGDWNNEPDSETLAKMREFMTVVSDERARTYNGFKMPAAAPADETCIDFIAVDSAHTAKVSVDETAVKYNFTSDHNPVFVTLKLMK